MPAQWLRYPVCRLGCVRLRAAGRLGRRLRAAQQVSNMFYQSGRDGVGIPESCQSCLFPPLESWMGASESDLAYKVN